MRFCMFLLLMGVSSISFAQTITIAADEATTLTDETLSNTSSTADGGILFNYGTLNVDNTTLENTTAGRGGGIYNYSSGVLNINAGTVIKNNTAVVGYGGGIYARGGFDVADGVIFENNQSIWGGGAIGSDLVGTASVPAPDNTTINIGKNVQFINNGAGFVEDSASNATWAQGGAIYNGTGTINIDEGTLFSQNKAINGGAIANDDIVNINGVSFTGNTAISSDNTDSTNEEVIFAVSTVISGLGGAIANNDDIIFTGNNTFSDNSADSYGGAIYNEGTITFNGTNTFTNNTANGASNDIYNTGSITISSGTTTLNGGITGTGDLTVKSGAILDITNTTSSVDTATFESDSTLSITVDNSSSYGSLTASTWSVDSGAILSLVVDETSVGSTVQVVGTDDFTLADNFLYSITANADETGSYTIAAKSSDDIASSIETSTGLSFSTAQKSALSSVLSLDFTQTTPLFQSVSAGLQSSDVATQQAAVKTLQELTPTTGAITQSVSVGAQQQLTTMATNRLSQVGTPGGDFANINPSPWIELMYNHTEQDSSPDVSGFHANMQGIAAGVETIFDKIYTLGMGYAYTSTRVKSDATKTNVYANNIFIYGQYKPSQFYLNTIVNASFGRYDEENTTKTADYNVNAFGGSIIAGYEMKNLDNTFGLRYTYIDNTGYTDSANQYIKSDNGNLLTAVIGTKYAKDMCLDKYLFKPMAYANLTYDIVSDNTSALVNIPGASTSYISTTKRLPRFGAELGVGISHYMDNSELTLSYNTGIRRDYLSQSGKLKYIYHF